MPKNPYDMITKGDKKPKKEIHKITHHKSHDGKIIHTHSHHRPEHHADETYVSNNADEMGKHMAEHEPNMTAAPSPMPEEAPAEGAGAAPAMPPAAPGM